MNYSVASYGVSDKRKVLFVHSSSQQVAMYSERKIAFQPNFFEKRVCTKVDRTETVKLKSMAHKNPSTWNPGTSHSVITTIRALITKLKRPKVKRVSGRVKTKTRGFTKMLTTPKTSATTKAVKKLST